MSEFAVTSILWAFITLGSPHYESVQVLEEFPTTETCMETAKELAIHVHRDMLAQKLSNVEVMLACIPILEVKDPQNLNGSGLIPKPKSKHNSERVG
jgi:hypothetical protein